VNVKRAILFCLPLLLAACGAPPEPPASNVIGDPLEQSLDKARSVEGLNSQRKDGLDEAVDEAN
jgi:hypothetical protein